jgi:hypothetical protein
VIEALVVALTVSLIGMIVWGIVYAVLDGIAPHLPTTRF